MSAPVVVGISGASGAAIAVRVVARLIAMGTGVELVVSDTGRRTLAYEAGPGALDEMIRAGAHLNDAADVGAPIASGTFPVAGMIVAPCSMRTLAAIAYGLSDNLLTRAADVQLKERRRLVLLARETPLHLGHLRAMTVATEIGAIVMPPLPAFYLRPASVAEVIDQIAARAVDLVGLGPATARAWRGEA